MNKIICDDVLSALSKIHDNSVHLIVTSPPFNVGIEYDGYNDSLAHSKYLEWMKTIWIECKRVLISGGRMCVNIDATTNLDESEDALIEKVHPLHVDFTNQLREIGFIYRAEIIWCKQNCSGNKTAWGSWCLPSNPHIRRNTEYLIIVSKDCLKLEGDSKKSDLNKDEFQAWTLSEWRIQPETRKHKIHPASFPRELPFRCIKLFSYVGNVVLDIFNGSGTTTTTAVELGRQYIGIDQSEVYCRHAREGVRKAKQELELSGGYNFVPFGSSVEKEV